MKLTKNFRLEEFNCSCGCAMTPTIVKNITKLAVQLQILRDRIGRPITVTSGYRCAKHNAAVGGAKHSIHKLGLACDVQINRVSPKEVAEEAEEIDAFKLGGIGVYPTFTHLDMRGYRSRWEG